MSKFKVGDRVVLIREKDAGTVWSIIDEEMDDPQLRVIFDLSGRRWGIRAYEFELESIYNSPLYRALL